MCFSRGSVTVLLDAVVVAVVVVVVAVVDDVEVMVEVTSVKLKGLLNSIQRFMKVLFVVTLV